MTLAEAARDFLAQERIAIVGVSRNPGDFTRTIFRKLRATGHRVVPINPHATAIDGVPCYPDLRAAPGPIGAVLIATPPDQSAGTVHECATLGIKRVWLHSGLGRGSWSPEAVETGRTDGVMLISAGCPLMFIPSADLGHRCLRWWLKVSKKLPESVVAATTTRPTSAAP